VQFLWSIIIVIGLIFLPETPRFLIKQDKHDAASASLAKLRRLPADHPAIVEELAEVQANHNYEMSLAKASYIDCFKGTIGKRLMTGCFLQGLQQLTGVNFIFYYGTQYFQNAGFAAGGFTIQVITNVVNVVSTVPGLYLVEKMGRRNLLLMGAIGMCVCQFIVAIVGTVSSTENLDAQRTAIAFVCIYIFFFASSWGPVAWVVTGELFPLKVRAKCLSMTTGELFEPLTFFFTYTDHTRTSYQLAPQLGHRLRHPLHGQREIRQPAIQGVLHLGQHVLHLHPLRVVHDLRDQGSDARGGRRVVLTCRQGVAEPGLRARGPLHGC
jgi:MFS family permease